MLCPSDALQCYHGSGHAQFNTTCSVKESHYILKKDDPVSSNMQKITHCLVFRPSDEQNILKYGCDDMRMCDKTKNNMWKTKVGSAKMQIWY